MNAASGAVRDGIAESIANMVGWFLGLFTHPNIALWVVGGLAALFVLWRLSVALGPEKTCWRCTGDGSVGGLLGGRQECSRCNGKGRRPRVGSGGKK